jgi:hypothetical protein
MKRYVRNGHALDRSRYVHKIGDRWYVAKRCTVNAIGTAIYAAPTDIKGIIGSQFDYGVKVVALSGLRGVRLYARSFKRQCDAVKYAAKVFGYEPVP